MKIFGISGFASSGKDTFFTESAEYLQSKGKICRRLSFADELKSEVFNFCMDHYGISPFTNNREEKELIRTLLISHGTIKRSQSNGTYWIDKLKANLLNVSFADYVFITDVRFKEFEYDESDFIKSIGGKLIYLSRSDRDIKPVGAEDENCKVIKEISDYNIALPTLKPDALKKEISNLWENVLA